MNKLIIITALLLCGCESTIYPREVLAADEACRPFGGWRKFEGSFDNTDMTKRPSVVALCTNGTEVTHRLSVSMTVEE